MSLGWCSGGDGDLAPDLAGFEVTHRVGEVGQGADPVDGRGDGAVLDHRAEGVEVGGVGDRDPERPVAATRTGGP